MIRRARRWDDGAQPKPISTPDRPIGIGDWRDREYQAGRPSGLLDYYRAHAICIACKGCGLHPGPTTWECDEPLFKPCKLCLGSGEVKVV